MTNCTYRRSVCESEQRCMVSHRSVPSSFGVLLILCKQFRRTSVKQVHSIHRVRAAASDRMFGFSSLVPYLLALSPNPTREILQQADSLYRDLGEPSVFKTYSPTITFSYVNPPTTNGTSTWRDSNPGTAAIVAQDDPLFFENIANKEGTPKPLALYLPGLDGVGVSATQQFDDLASTFEFWRMSVSTLDRTSFADLTSAVEKFIDDIAVQQNREVIIIGESFGGLLTPAVAMRMEGLAERQNIPNPIKGRVMINPATSYEESDWTTLGPLLTSLRYLEKKDGTGTTNFPTPYSIAGGIALSQRIPDSRQLKQIVSMMMDTQISSFEDASDMLGVMGESFGFLAKQLPAEVVEHRLTKWLSVGAADVNARLSTLNISTLVVAGQEDKLLPSKKEADRLVEVMPSCKKLEVKGSGHFVLDDRVNLTEAIIYSDIDPLQLTKEKPMDPITEWKLPPKEEIDRLIKSRVKPLRRLTSPIFFSTRQDGSRQRGLSHIPSPNDGPILFVSNHQFGGLDLTMIVAQLLEDRGIAARGLAHPVIFQGGPGGGGGSRRGERSNQRGIRQVDGENRLSNDVSDFEKFGAVKVTPKNYYRLMQTGQTALLFPGGVREVFHGKDEAYKLLWPEGDFVRTAARFNATIVPLSAIGAAESVNIFIDSEEMVKLPFGIGERISNSSANTISARFDTPDSGELFAPPFALPNGLPARHYFVFGKAIRTDGIDHRDLEACKELFKDVKGETERGFSDVLSARKKDPFADSPRRLAYEQIWGKQAPTFTIETLNR